MGRTLPELGCDAWTCKGQARYLGTARMQFVFEMLNNAEPHFQRVNRRSPAEEGRME
jgi:hypothetical protein